MRKIRVLHVITDLDRGGVEMQLVEILKKLPNIDHYVFCLTGEGALSANISNAKVFHATSRNPIVLLRELRRLTKAFRPQVIQTWMFHADLVGGLANFGDKTPILWSYHASIIPRKSVSLRTYFIIRTLGRLSTFIPQKIIVCSKSSFESALENGYPRKKLQRINNGIDTNFYTPVNLPIEKDMRNIVMPARWHEHKGHSVLLEAWGLLKQRGVNGNLVLMGKSIDNQNQELNALLQKYKITKSVITLGEVQDTRAVYQTAHVVVLSSITEAMPLALCEAMSCGLVPVVTNVGDMKEMIGESGFWCESNDALQLSQALEQVLSLSDDEYAGRSTLARSQVEKNYNINQTSSEYEAVWNRSILQSSLEK